MYISNNNDYKNRIDLTLKTLPNQPGVYRYYDEDEKLLYIGKAKNLKKRVSTYFLKTHDSGRIKLLVSKIRDIQITVVNSEWEALLLENNMIKNLKPRFNVMLKDDKTYPWIAITKEKFPRIFLTRKPDREKYDIFGPYASVFTINNLMQLFKDAYKLRICKQLEKRPCLQYQIKKCLAPCANLISEEEYGKQIQQIKKIIKGDIADVVKDIKVKMLLFSDKLEFEKSQQCKELLSYLEKFKEKSVIVNPSISRVDVFSIAEDEESAFINFLRVIDGAVIQSYSFEIVNKENLPADEILLHGIAEINSRFGNLCSEIIVPFLPKIEIDNTTFIVPAKGDKKKLLELSQQNSRFYKLEKFKKADLINPERHSVRILTDLQNILGLREIPNHIECFDNSNTGGDEPVAAMVCFIKGKPSKRCYRHFNIKTVIGPDDFASMYEVIYRRYSRLQKEKLPLPQLVIVDGGKGQLGAAYSAVKKLKLEKEIMLISIAKKLEDIYKVGDPLPLFIDKKSEVQKLIQQIRDEVHRFGIEHHIKKRDKKSISSKLDFITGIGKSTKEKLLYHFKSIKRIESATEEEISKIIGVAKAKIMIDYFNSKK